MDVVVDGCVADDVLDPTTLPDWVVLVEGEVVAVDELVVGEVALASLAVLPERVVPVLLDAVELL